MKDIVLLKESYFKKINGKYKRTKPKKLRMVDLFAGTGGFTIAFKKSNKVDIVMANDFCDKSAKIYEHNFPKHNFIYGDINDIDSNQIPDHDILTGGFPCQSFSIAGKQLGFKDKRANVFFKIIDIMNTKKPRFAVLENVKNLESHDKGKTFKVIQQEITNIGYYMKYSILNTAFTTKIPQNRERIYIVCFKFKDDYDNFNMSFNTTTPDDISNYLESNINEKYYYSKKFKVWDKVKDTVKKHIDTNTVYQYRRYYVRENKSNLCPTLCCNMGSGGHNTPLIKDDEGIRKLTPKECFNLQGFPSNYKLCNNMSDSGLYKLAGNAISIGVANKVAKKIIDITYH